MITVARAAPTSAMSPKYTTKPAAVQMAPSAASDARTCTDGIECGQVRAAAGA